MSHVCGFQGCVCVYVVMLVSSRCGVCWDVVYVCMYMYECVCACVSMHVNVHVDATILVFEYFPPIVLASEMY